MTSSPCIKLCKIDSTGRCEGCNRTLEQIEEWSLYTEEERKEIMQQLQQSR